MTRFVDRISDFRLVAGVRGAHRVVGAWVVDGQTIESVNFEVQQFEFDWKEPY